METEASLKSQGLIEITHETIASGAVPVLDVAKVVAREHKLAEKGTSLLTLMRRAGAAIATKVRESAPTAARILVLAGSGNNGGDGWVTADLLARAGCEVTLVTKMEAAALTAEPARTAALEAANAASCTVVVSPDHDEIKTLVAQSNVVIDALLGTGFTHDEVREPFASWITMANDARASGVRIVAADCPSGLNAQTGEAAKQCICADETVTMIAVKTGLVSSEARPHVGDLFLAPLEG